MLAHHIFNASVILASMEGLYSIFSSIDWFETFIVILHDQIAIESALLGTSFSFHFLYLVAQSHSLNG